MLKGLTNLTSKFEQEEKAFIEEYILPHLAATVLKIRSSPSTNNFSVLFVSWDEPPLEDKNILYNLLKRLLVTFKQENDVSYVVIGGVYDSHFPLFSAPINDNAFNNALNVSCTDNIYLQNSFYSDEASYKYIAVRRHITNALRRLKSAKFKTPWNPCITHSTIDHTSVLHESTIIAKRPLKVNFELRFEFSILSMNANGNTDLVGKCKAIGHAKIREIREKARINIINDNTPTIPSIILVQDLRSSEYIESLFNRPNTAMIRGNAVSYKTIQNKNEGILFDESMFSIHPLRKKL